MNQNPYDVTDELQPGASSSARQRVMAVTSMYVGYAMFMVLRMAGLQDEVRC